MEMEKFYVAPVVEVMEVEVEKGYSLSADDIVTPPGGSEEGI